MIEGRLRAFLEEVSLLSQPFIKESSKRIQQLLQENHASMDTFVRFEVGEGMEKKEDNFVAEVMAQVRDRNA
jgi:elongation factor Ts